MRELQTRIYWLISDDELDTPDIAEIVGRDRSSVQRALQDLVALGLATRTSLPVEKGRKFGYRGVSVEKLRGKLAQVANEYHEKVLGDIQKLEKKKT